ncbi:MAG: ATP-binding protein [Candidatus Omnitrophica bacterium]|jgi:signal transduction histidine kinase|nr:ATP-binding protein [Candidatus Omnitrophota bacterium]
MLVIFFFYGLAFLLMGLVISLMPKKNDLFGLSDNLWMIGVFGFIHGINEWVDLLILIGKPFDVAILKTVGAILLPLSFIFLVIFGVRVIFKANNNLRYLKYLWVPVVAVWLFGYFLTKDFLISGIIARYFLCLPGTWMTAIGLYSIYSQADMKQVPRPVLVSTWVASVTFFAYGVLSGIVVPKADFIFASFINYPNFNDLTGVPVQFYRMICAIILALSFFFLTGVYFYGDKKRIEIRRGITGRFSIVFSSVAVISVLLTCVIIISWMYQFMVRDIKSKQLEVAKALSYSIGHMIDNKIYEFQVHLGKNRWRQAVIEQNAQYSSVASEAIVEDMLKKDVLWASDAPELLSLLESPVSLDLKELADVDREVAEIFLTDRYGGLVAASRKTTDFYQADELWWQKAYSQGKGDIFVGDIEMDQSSNALSIPIALPVFDQAGQALGAAKEYIEIGLFFSPLKKYRAGITGHAALVDGKGNVIFHENIKPFSAQLFSEKDILKALSRSDLMSGRIEDTGKRRGSFNSIYRIDNQILRKNGVIWYVCVLQDIEELFASLGNLIIGMVLLMLVVISIAIFLSLKIGMRFSVPIRKLNIAAERIIAGEWDYPIDIKTGDEIEQFAEAFREMIVQLKKQQDALIVAKHRIEDFSRHLEEKVEERTKELSRVQEATLNILEDLTEAKDKMEKYSQDLEKALHVKSDFISVVSHELRTPLTAIKEGIALVQDLTLGPLNDEQKEFLDIARKNMDRLARLINEVLDFQKLDAGAMVFKIKEGNLNSLVSEVVQAMRPLIEAKNLTLEMSLEEALPDIKIDRDKIIQVLTNLMNNALKFTQQGGITVCTGRHGNVEIVSVRDTGPGIKEEDKDRLFQMFSQLESPNERKVGGTGLGLAIAKKIIEIHRGKIWVESTYGQGATFSFLLPIVERRV